MKIINYKNLKWSEIHNKFYETEDLKERFNILLKVIVQKSIKLNQDLYYLTHELNSKINKIELSKLDSSSKKRLTILLNEAFFESFKQFTIYDTGRFNTKNEHERLISSLEKGKEEFIKKTDPPLNLEEQEVNKDSKIIEGKWYEGDNKMIFIILFSFLLFNIFFYLFLSNIAPWITQISYLGAFISLLLIMLSGVHIMEGLKN